MFFILFLILSLWNLGLFLQLQHTQLGMATFKFKSTCSFWLLFWTTQVYGQRGKNQPVWESPAAFATGTGGWFEPWRPEAVSLLAARLISEINFMSVDMLRNQYYQTTTTKPLTSPLLYIAVSKVLTVVLEIFLHVYLAYIHGVFPFYSPLPVIAPPLFF